MVSVQLAPRRTTRHSATLIVNQKAKNELGKRKTDKWSFFILKCVVIRWIQLTMK